MTKVVRAFSLDPRVSETLDEMTSVPGRAKPMNKSRYVNEALDWYMTKNLGEFIKDWDQTRTWYQDKLEENRLTIGGLEDDLASLREAKACPSRWCRLKRLLKISPREKPEQ
ncbi:MAG: hypothetical protein [Circular genetic element sp.]|nr:MAG: hypothetical protein [Circular genetic element sp.]